MGGCDASAQVHPSPTRWRSPPHSRAPRRYAATAMSLAVDALTNCAGGPAPSASAMDSRAYGTLASMSVRDAPGTAAIQPTLCAPPPVTCMTARRGLAWTASTAALSAGSMTGVDSAGGSLCRAPSAIFILTSPSARAAPLGEFVSSPRSRAHKTRAAARASRAFDRGSPARAPATTHASSTRADVRSVRKCVRGLDPPDLARAPAVGAPSLVAKIPSSFPRQILRSDRRGHRADPSSSPRRTPHIQARSSSSSTPRRSPTTPR